MTTLLAFHNDAKVARKYRARVRAHRKADQLIKGQYWTEGRGCAVGCTIHSDNHRAYETELGIPQVLARLEDRIFEGLPNKHAMEWPTEFLKAIKVGADLSGVADQFLLWLMRELLTFCSEHSKPCVQTVEALYARKVGGKIVTREEWHSAAYAYAAADAAAKRDRFYIKMADKLLKLLKAAPVPCVGVK